METVVKIKPRVGFVGVGWIGRNRMQAAAASKLADIAGFADPSDECLNEASQIIPAKKFDSFELMISDNEVDAIVIATPSALHKQQAIDAFKNGKAVFCQKPLGRNAAEVKEVIGAAASANLLLGADFSYRFTEAFDAVLNVVRSGELGEVFAVELKFHNAYGPGKPWFYDIKQAGGGCVLDLGVHLIDLLLFAFNFPKVRSVQSSLFAKGRPVQRRSEVEDYADVMLELENNINAHLSCSWNLHAGREAIIEAGFYGTNGGVSFNNVNGSFYDFEAKRFYGTRTEVVASPPDDWSGKAILDWLNKLNSGKHFQPEAAHYLASADVIDRIYGDER